MRRPLAIVLSLILSLAAGSARAADAVLEKTLERAKEKRQQEVSRASEAYQASVTRADADLRRVFEAAIAVAKKKKDDARAESLAAQLEAILSGTEPTPAIDDKQLEGAVKRRVSVVETSTKAFKLAADRATATLEKTYEQAIASYKKKNDEARGGELAQEIAAIKAEEVTPAAGSSASASGGSKSRSKGHVDLIKAIGESVITTDGTSQSPAVLAEKKYVLVYFSGHWCPPCRLFTPELVKFHEDYAKKYNIEVLFVSADRSAEQFTAYMKEAKMPWLAVPYAQVNKTGLMQTHNVTGFPHLILMDQDGKTVSSSMENGAYVGPQKVLVDLREKLGIKG